MAIFNDNPVPFLNKWFKSLLNDFYRNNKKNDHTVMN